MASAPLAVKLFRVFRGINNIRGGHRLLLSLVKRYGGQNFVVENNGIRIRCDMASYIEWHIAALGGFEEEEKGIFCAIFPPERRRTILDIGANIGSHSLGFARVFDTVVAFDPNPVVFERLEYNLALNQGLNVQPHNIGLGENPGSITFYQPKQGYANQGTGTFDISFAPKEHDVVAREVIRGDDFIALSGIGHVDGIKMDVQGFEPQVLAGLCDTLRRDRPVIWLEISETTISELDRRGGLGTIIPSGYRLSKFNNRSRTSKIALEEQADFRPSGEGDYVLIPAEIT